MVKISVIIPIYNDGKYLRQCLNSISNQSLKDIEIICINDGSTDDTSDILREYADNDKRIIIINQKNQGSAIARNNGLDIAKGEYIGFLDSDDMYINEKSLEILYKTARKYDAEMVSGNLKFLTKKRKIIHNHHYDKKTFYYFSQYCEISPDEYGIPYYFTKNIFRADLLEDIRFPELLRDEDPLFLSKILTKVDRIYGVPIDFYAYMVPTSDKSDTYEKKYRSIWQYKQCIDLLNEYKLFKTSDKYMNNLILFLNNKVDVEFYDIVCEVFYEREDYFKNYKDEYESFKKANILNKILVENTQEYYLKAKAELGLAYKSLEEYKIEYFKTQLKIKEKEYREELSKNNKLKTEFEREKSFNKEVLNSKSWKMMNKLRKIRG